MKKRIIILGVSMLAIMAMSSCGNKEELKTLRAQAEEYQNKLFEQDDTIAEKEEQISSLQEQIQKANDEKESLKQEIEKQKSEKDSLQEQLEAPQETSSDAQNLLDLIFPIDGKSYSASESVIFYRDPQLSQRVDTGDNLNFVSAGQQQVVTDKERSIKVWVARSDQGFLYSADKPGLKEK